MVTASNNYLMTVADNAPEPIDVVYRDSPDIPADVWAAAPYDLDAIINGVWDEVMTQHNVAGSFGKRLKEILPTLWGIK